jgi:hypothetical protein
MAFRVLVFGPTWFRDYSRLRAVMDTALAHLLQDVALVTAGVRGFPSLVASYARSRGLELETVLLDYVKYPSDPRPARNAELVARVHAAVIVWYDLGQDVREVGQAVVRKRIPVHDEGLPRVRRVRTVQRPRRVVNLPD